jgi:hypothetical protein
VLISPPVPIAFIVAFKDGVTKNQIKEYAEGIKASGVCVHVFFEMK